MLNSATFNNTTNNEPSTTARTVTLTSVTDSGSGTTADGTHVHQRRNRYQAELDIPPVDGVWKLTGLEILQEERL